MSYKRCRRDRSEWVGVSLGPQWLPAQKSACPRSPWPVQWSRTPESRALHQRRSQFSRSCAAWGGADVEGPEPPHFRPQGLRCSSDATKRNGTWPALHFFCAAWIGPAEQVDLIEVLWCSTFSAQAANGATCASF